MQTDVKPMSNNLVHAVHVCNRDHSINIERSNTKMTLLNNGFYIIFIVLIKS
jgi:hypothetical protein